MDLNKALCTVLFIFFGFSLLSAQSLVELAKKERQRRAKIEKKGIIVTNSTLSKLKKIPAISVLQTSESVPKKLPQKSPQLVSDVRAKPNQLNDEAKFDFKASEDLEKKWKKAQEYVALLTLKMNALWHEYYSMDDMTPRDLIKQEISKTFLHLQKVKKEEEDIRKKIGKNL